jgi:hypothetical protein
MLVEVHAMSAPKRPPPTFEVLFRGPGVYPERVPLRLLARALGAVQRLAGGEEVQAEDEADSAETPFGLTGIRRGSAVYQFAPQSADRLVPAAASNFRTTRLVIADPDQIGDRGFLLDPLKELSTAARSLGAEIVLRSPGRDGEVYAVIDADSYQRVADRLVVGGDTTLFGRLERVGGSSEPRCAIRLDERRRLLYCAVATPSLAPELGRRLYQRVALHGKAQWLKTNWRVVAFDVTGVSQPQRRSADEVIAAVRAAGGSDWDRIADPKAFLADNAEGAS